AREMVAESESEYDVTEMLRMLEDEMLDAANNLEFEKAADLRDKIKDLRAKRDSGIAKSPDAAGAAEAAAESDLTAALAAGMSARIAGTEGLGGTRKVMTPQQKKV